jgi:hypothetical protein
MSGEGPIPVKQRVRALRAQIDAMEFSLGKLQRELERLTGPSVGPSPEQEPLDEVWRMIEMGWDIESRAYFEETAPKMGFKHPLSQAVHHMHKRCVRENPDWLREPVVPSLQERTMTEKAPEVTLVCPCGSRAFYATPDGADSYILQCSACGCHSEISAGRGMTLSLTEVADAPPEPKD